MSKVRYIQDKLQFFRISKTKKQTKSNMEFLQKSRSKYFRYFKEQAIANRVFRTVEQHFQYFWTTCMYSLHRQWRFRFMMIPLKWCMMIGCQWNTPTEITPLLTGLGGFSLQAPFPTQPRRLCSRVTCSEDIARRGVWLGRYICQMITQVS